MSAQNNSSIFNSASSSGLNNSSSFTTGEENTLNADSLNILSLLQDTIRYFLSREIPVYLDGFGILFARVRPVDRSYPRNTDFIVRKEHIRTIEFEKCSNLSSFHRESYPGLMELKDLSQRVYAFLPVHRAIQYSEREIRGLIAHLIEQLIYNVISKGNSQLFSALGTFYALHNRQGTEFKDWFAGADIFLHSHYSEPTSVSACVVRERPSLESSWELLQAAYGAPLLTLDLNLHQQLAALGYDTAEFPRDMEHHIPVAVFQAYAAREKTYYLIYCTDGLRKLGLNSKRSKGFGTEMVFQLPISGELSVKRPRDLDDIPRWPLRPLTMGWILMQSVSSKTLRAGLKISEEGTLLPDSDSDLSAIFTTQFGPAREEQLSIQGPFYFTNIIGITQDEYDLAERNGSLQLQTILEYKKLLQFTKPLRSSLTARSSFHENDAQQSGSHILKDPRISTALEGSRSFVPA